MGCFICMCLPCLAAVLFVCKLPIELITIMEPILLCKHVYDNEDHRISNVVIRVSPLWNAPNTYNFMSIEPYSYLASYSYSSLYIFSFVWCLQVVRQQPVQNSVDIQEKPNNYMIFSLLNLLFCCLCIGIAALSYSLKVSHWLLHDCIN